jgi:hypothetical protein
MKESLSYPKLNELLFAALDAWEEKHGLSK